MWGKPAKDILLKNAPTVIEKIYQSTANVHNKMYNLYNMFNNLYYMYIVQFVQVIKDLLFNVNGPS